MELNEMEKKMLFQAEGDCQAKVLNELYMTVRYSNNSELRETAESLMAKVRVLSDRECMDLVRDIQKNYRLPYPPRTIGERIAEARQQSGAEKLKGHDIMGLERFDPEVKHMIVFDVLSYAFQSVQLFTSTSFAMTMKRLAPPGVQVERVSTLSLLVTVTSVSTTERSAIALSQVV